MKRLLITSLALILSLTACQKQETPPPAEENKTNEQTTNHADHQHDGEQHEGEHHNDNHAHEGHDHNHAGHEHNGDNYTCNNNKTITIAIHDHEGEIEAHATIDDVEYDLNPDTDKENQYISKEEGINNKGMTMTLKDNKAVFADLDGKELLSCTKS